jgi:hypothetical protein
METKFSQNLSRAATAGRTWKEQEEFSVKSQTPKQFHLGGPQARAVTVGFKGHNGFVGGNTQ